MSTIEAETVLAACRDADPGLFFPAASRTHHEKQVTAAKSLCHSCPMRQPCLTRALQLNESEGIWGGFTGAERRWLRVHALRLSSLDRQVIDDLLAGLPVTVKSTDRPAVVHWLVRLGWSHARIGQALRLEPFAVQTAWATATNAAFYAAAERQASQG
jgi:WhiB family redox-sensing transcriptional regulator